MLSALRILAVTSLCCSGEVQFWLCQRLLKTCREAVCFCVPAMQNWHMECREVMLIAYRIPRGPQKCHQLPSQLVPASSTTSGVCCCCCCPAKCASACKSHHTSEPQVTSAVIYTCFIFCSTVIEMLIYEHMRAVIPIT